VLGFFLYFIGFIAFAWLVRLIILLLKRQQWCKNILNKYNKSAL
jgi:hypothetical protein